MDNDEQYYIIETDPDGSITYVGQTIREELVARFGKPEFVTATLMDYIDDPCTATWGTESRPGVLIIKGKIVDPADLRKEYNEN